MALSVTNPTLSTTFDSTEVDANFGDVVNKFGAIDNSDIKNGAGIAVDKLNASYQEVWLQLKFTDAIFGAWPVAPGDPAAPTRAELIDYVPLPGSDADTAWVATDVSWTSNDTGTTAASFDVRYGAFGAGGVMVGAGNVVTGVTMPVTGNNLGNEGRALEGGSVTLTQSSTVRGLYLVSAGQGVAALNNGAAPYSWLNVTVALRRQIQA